MSHLQMEEALRQAMEHHQGGRFQQAEQIYRHILSVDPRCALAMHLLGLMAHQLGHSAEGAKLIEQAIQHGLSNVESFHNLAECYRSLGRHGEAIAAYRAAIQCSPDQVEPLHSLGLLHFALGQYADALPLLERVARLQPDLPGTHHGYAAALAATGRMDEAIAELEQTLALEPNHREALKELGVILQQRGRVDDAMKLLDTLVTHHPDFVDGHMVYANSLAVSGRMEDAIRHAKRAVELAPTRFDAHHTLANVYRMAHRYDEAWNETFATLELNPDFFQGLGNFAHLGEKMGSYARAIEWLESAVQKFPNNAAFWIALSELHGRERRIEKSIEVLDRALEYQPQHPDLHMARSVRLLSAGRFVEGFQEYNWRHVLRLYVDMVKNAGKTMWDGSDPAGKHLFVYAEQGFGDIIQFARYLPMLVEQGATLTIATGKKEICPLLEAFPGVAEVVVGEETLPHYEHHVALMSLPSIFKTTLETIPNKIPYIHAAQSKIQQWKPVIDAHARGVKVGFVWGGKSPSDPRRVCTVKDLAPLADVPDVSWYSLQTDQPREQLKDAPAQMRVLDIGKDLHDFTDTAAVIAQLDLVISIDTAVAHLAGAMGVKTWLMLPLYAEWRWFYDGDTSPWYPTMKLFRQNKLDDWSGVVEAIREELAKLSPERQS